MKTSSRNYGGANLKKTTQNDMPVPEGCFKMQDAARQRGHNTVLAIGVASLTFAIFLVGHFEIQNLNCVSMKTVLGECDWYALLPLQSPRHLRVNVITSN